MIRRLVFIGVLLAIGAVISVAVAWGWAAWGVPPHLTSRTWSISHREPPLWLMREFSGAGAAITHVRPQVQSGQYINSLRAVADMGPEVPARVRSRFTDRPAPDQTWTRFAFDERGWPWRCLRSEHAYRWVNRPNRFIDEVQVKSGIQLWPEQTRRGGWALQRVRALPLQPIWPALIANTILYAILAAVALVGYPAMVRALGARRSARRAMLAAALGLPLVVGVSLAAAWAGPRSLDRGGTQISGALIERQDRTGGTRLVFRGGSFSAFDQLPVPPTNGVAPRWAAQHSREAAQREWQPFAWMTVEGVGWPARALASCFESHAKPDLTIAVSVQRGILLDPLPQGFDVGAPYDLRLLPTQVLWTGFALNWLLYAMILLGLLAAPGAFRRGLRRRGGRCPECGYNLRGEFNAGCPECGWGRTADTAAPGVAS